MDMNTENGNAAEMQDDGSEAKQPQQDSHDKSNSATSKEDEKEPASPPRQTFAALDMTGSIRSPTSVISRLKKRASGKIRRPSKSESSDLPKQRFKYDDNSDSESASRNFDLSSDMDFMSGELTVQQIHDQRAKLESAANSDTTTKNQAAVAAAAPPPSSHQISSFSSKQPRSPKASGAPVRPGAYVVDSGNNLSVRGTTKDSDDDSDVLGNNDYASSIMQLEAIPVDETEEQAKIKEMEEQMELEISRRMSLERKISKERKTRGDEKSWIKERMPIIMALLIIISAIAVGIYFLTAPASAEAATSTYFIYPPPTEEECSAIENGTKVPNQDKYFALTMDIEIDVSFQAKMTDSIDSNTMSEVEDLFEKVFIPTVVGCNYIGQSQEYFNRTFTEDRYMIANMDILNVTRSTAECNAGEPSPCVRSVVRYVAWLKGESSVLDMISLIQSNFGPNLIRNVKGNNEIIQATLVSISTPGTSKKLTPADETVDFLFPPPTDEECEAVLNRQPVPNQDTYFTLTVDTIFDVTTYDTYTNDTVLEEIREKFESYAIPTLAGCTTASQDVVNTTDRYILANANLTSVARSSFDCDPGQLEPCEQIVARWTMWLKSEAELFDLFTTLHTNFRPILLASITDSNVIREFVLVSVGPSPPDAIDDSSNPKLLPGVDLLFPPPTEEVCEQLLNGTGIPNRESYFTMLADGVIDVSTYDPWEDNLDAVLLELHDQFESIILPIMAGCKEIDKDQLMGKNTTADRYALADGIVLNVTESPLECSAKEPKPCVRAVIELQMWVKMEVTIFEVIAGIDQNFGPALIHQIGRGNDSAELIKQAEMVILFPPL